MKERKSRKLQLPILLLTPRSFPTLVRRGPVASLVRLQTSVPDFREKQSRNFSSRHHLTVPFSQAYNTRRILLLSCAAFAFLLL